MSTANGKLYKEFLKAKQLEKEGRREEALASYSNFITLAESRLQAVEARDIHSVATIPSPLQEKLGLAYNNRGFLYYLKVEFTLAVEDYTQALVHNTGLAVTYYNRGLIHYRLGHFQAAVEDMQKALSIVPDFEPAQQCLRQSSADLKSA